ncbi:hypothetical protein [Nonomuraea aurantiaca]|uniref:hypothetical protein n=1 Tax=Nonomuraea aurantiaca TaxID=2878562 RepID=UPI001CD967A7|nr:hypothetical protein [Nonomuraea aurantiaca]MCA2229742.1 hypothetical protein [Nonomuraea aurantiaca]
MIASPVIHEFGGPPPCEDRTGRLPFALELLDRPGRRTGLRARVSPLVQPLAIVATEIVVGIGDVPVERH